jgi:pimeloyl-ACP methyl ester carboxylesterase
MPILKVSDAAVMYETAGSGEPLVLIPGFASGRWSWKYQIGALAREFNVITFDPRGVSRSKLADGATATVERIADDVAALIDKLGLERAHVLGISFGGFVAQDLALRYPSKLSRLVLACTSYGGAGHVAPALEVLMAFSSTAGLNTRERIRQYLTMAFTPEFVADQPEIVDEFCRLREENVVPERVYMDQLLSATKFDAAARVGEIDAATLVLTGDGDMVVPRQNSVNLAAAIPGAKMVTIADAGHMFFVEKAEEFNSAVVDFLTRE